MNDASKTFAKLMGSVMLHADVAFNGPKPRDAKADWRQVGVVMLTFAYGDRTSGVANYISNGADRRDIIKFLRETADRFERNEGIEPVKVVVDGPPPAEPSAAPEAIPTLNVLHADSDNMVRQHAIDGSMIAFAWEGFRKFVIPPDAGEAQLTDLKGTFFAGAHTMFEFLAAVGDDLAEDEAMAIMSGLNEELRAYADLMGAVADAKEAESEGKLN